jgi:hypothetical protein
VVWGQSHPVQLAGAAEPHSVKLAGAVEPHSVKLAGAVKPHSVKLAGAVVCGHSHPVQSVVCGHALGRYFLQETVELCLLSYSLPKALHYNTELFDCFIHLFTLNQS